ncbi:MAG: CD225/dispanin family protein [Micromonosporaceae bacterium]
MTNMQDPPPDWGDATEWQQQQPSSGQPPYGAGYQQPPGSAQPPYGAYQQPPPAPPPQYPQPPWQGATAPAIQTYMLPAILVTLFCFLPTGIAAIIFASQVSSKRNAGDYNGAVHASKQARLWTIVSLVAGIVVIGIVVIASAASNSGSSV